MSLLLAHDFAAGVHSVKPSKSGLVLRFLLLPFPSAVKVAAYRHLFGYRIGSGVRIGLSVLACGACEIGDRTRIGHFNLFHRIGVVRMGSDVVVGHFNLVIGGDEVRIGDRALIGRFNEINSILDPVNSNPSDPRLLIGNGAVVTAWHKIDYTDRVEIDDNAILAGRLSSLWTHNRQQTKPVRIGRNCYVGSGIQMVPGASVGDCCVIGLGSVITKPLDAEWSLVAGVPAKVIKPLDAESRAMVEFTTRPDLDIP
jgi:acetyltransferase-like isoleucine patch superfamily enzyme